MKIEISDTLIIFGNKIEINQMIMCIKNRTQILKDKYQKKTFKSLTSMDSNYSTYTFYTGELTIYVFFGNNKNSPCMYNK